MLVESTRSPPPPTIEPAQPAVSPPASQKPPGAVLALGGHPRRPCSTAARTCWSCCAPVPIRRAPAMRRRFRRRAGSASCDRAAGAGDSVDRRRPRHRLPRGPGRLPRGRPRRRPDIASQDRRRRRAPTSPRSRAAPTAGWCWAAPTARSTHLPLSSGPGPPPCPTATRSSPAWMPLSHKAIRRRSGPRADLGDLDRRGRPRPAGAAGRRGCDHPGRAIRRAGSWSPTPAAANCWCTPLTR